MMIYIYTAQFFSQRYLTSVVLFAGLFVFVNQSCAQDKLFIKTENGQGKFSLKGEIIDWKGDTLVIKTLPKGIVKQVSTENILKIETYEFEDYQLALKAISQRDYASAIKMLNEAYLKENRIWFRREILSHKLTCLLNMGRTEDAVHTFLSLTSTDEETRHFKLIPVPYTHQKENAPTYTLALKHMQNGQNEIEKLMGAAYLLLDAKHQKSANDTLKTLTYSKNLKVAFVAKSQLWRTQIDSNTGNGILKLWDDAIRYAPKDTRVPAYLILGNAYAEVGRTDEAIENWLRPWSENYPDRYLTARYLNRTKKMMEKMRRKEEAIRIEQILIKDYGDFKTVVNARQPKP